MDAPSRFFGKTYDETIALLHAARDYCAVQEPSERAALTPLERLRVSRETLRLTTRLAHVMSWLLAQKAVHAGEIALRDAAAEPFQLSRASVCLEPSEDDDALSPRLLKLLAESHRLYVRVARLDDLVRRSAEDSPRPFGPPAAS